MLETGGVLCYAGSWDCERRRVSVPIYRYLDLVGSLNVGFVAVARFLRVL